ncbi:MAG: FAD-dependent oxidoreductase, partial [Chloroflexi bacterium]
MNDESDVLVCGAGMAGLCAAVTAAHAGARVLVLEKAERLGGSMRLSGGTVWTAPSMAVMERYVGGGDRERQRRLVAGIGPGLAWLAGLGVPDGLAIENEAQVGRELDPEALTEGLSTAVAAAGGRIVAESAVDELRRDA